MSNTILAHSEKLSKDSNIPNRLNLIITTLGKEGCLCCFKDGSVKYFPTEPVKEDMIKSVIGAGDSFTGGFVFGLYQKKDFEKCIEYG